VTWWRETNNLFALNMDIAQRILRPLQEEGDSELGLEASLIVGTTPEAAATPTVATSGPSPTKNLLTISRPFYSRDAC
jgi:hypothetical protein